MTTGNEMEEMSFLDHMEELRWHVLRSLAAVIVLMVIAFISKEIIFHHILLGPSRANFYTYQLLCKISNMMKVSAFCIEELPFEIQSRKLTGQFTMHLLASFVAGIIIAFPYIFWEIWRFIKPALYGNEKKFARGTVFFVSILFFTGVMFGYYVIVPLSINFLSSYQVDETIINQIDISNYVSTVTTLVMISGLVFQFPVFSFFLSRAGLISVAFLQKYQKHAIVIIMILSAIITPPDPASQILIAIPIFFLYQLSILIAKKVEKKKRKLLLQETKLEDDKLLDVIED